MARGGRKAITYTLLGVWSAESSYLTVDSSYLQVGAISI